MGFDGLLRARANVVSGILNGIDTSIWNPAADDRLEHIARLDTTRTGELGYVAKAIEKVVAHFGDSRGIIGFCGAPFTLASYMVEGASSRSFIETMRFSLSSAFTNLRLS